MEMKEMTLATIAPILQKLQLPSSLKRFRKRHLISKFNVPADWQSVGDPRYFYAERFDYLRYVLGRGFALCVRVCGYKVSASASNSAGMANQAPGSLNSDERTLSARSIIKAHTMKAKTIRTGRAAATPVRAKTAWVEFIVCPLLL